MPSLIPGYEYDIFISYRHNDNLSGWVTEFVKTLQEELAATLKDPVTVYFDTNPHDGLSENHNVDKSLEGKLKCLIFIPVISQTYCDPKSFAWQNEFCAFNNFAKSDALGRDIKLKNGNVASRILPIKIHDLDPSDKSSIEKELGSILRAVEFIFRSVGVNRPLQSIEDNPQDNLNKTYYRDQINKVANAVKEIIFALKPNEDPGHLPAINKPVKNEKQRFRSRLLAAIVIIGAMATAYWLETFPNIDPGPPLSHKSIAVLAFKDLSPGKNQTWLSEGLAEEILNRLADLPDLHVPGRTSSFYFSDKSFEFKEIAQKLDVEYILNGSVMVVGDDLKVSISLVKASDGNQVWSDRVNTKLDNALELISGISTNVASQLEVVLDDKKREILRSIGTKDLKAFEYFLRGRKIFNDYHLSPMVSGDLWTAKDWFDKALEKDSTMYLVYLFRCDVYLHYLQYNSPGPPKGELSMEEAERLWVSDLTYSETHCKRPYEKLIATFQKEMFSHNWSRLPSLGELLLKQDLKGAIFPTATIVAPWVYLSGQTELAQSGVKAEYLSDPLNTYAYFGMVTLYGGQEKYDEIQTLCRTIRENYGDSSLLQLADVNSKLLQGRLTEVISELEKPSVHDTFLTAYGQVLAGKQLDQNTISSIKKVGPLGLGLLILWQMGDIKSANEIITRLDKKNAYLVYEIISYFSVFHTPFELSAAPNFVRQMKEAGVDAEKVFKPMPRFAGGGR